MADERAAVDEVLQQEDSTLSGVVTTDAGGRTRFGIAEKYHPWIAATGFYDTMTKDEALGAALVVYTYFYCIPLQITAIANQAVANKLLSLVVNVDFPDPVKWLQEAVGALPDGLMGPATIAAVNKADSQKALDALKQQAVLFYRADVAAHPEKEPYLQGWINRALA